ncbi:MAG: nicotinamide riboside transporter PnuC [Bacteroidales bacterium]|nr:nicotinamide riboside transporter PnuC [Bacteroidales bacterium]MDY0217006.1 nicotinamide riboside transporter PnuC [Bacteroidales bacterium]
MQIIIEYFQNNILESVAAFFGLLYLLLAARENYICWISGIINVAIFGWIFYHEQIFANMFLQIIYFGISIYGFYAWITKKKEHEAVIGKMDASFRGLVLILIILLTAATYLILQKTNSNMLFADALTAAAGIVATWMQARKYIENWLIWIPTDMLLTYLFFSHGLYITASLFAIYTIIAVYAFFNWNRKLKKASK